MKHHKSLSRYKNEHPADGGDHGHTFACAVDSSMGDVSSEIMKLFETPQIEFTSDDYYTPRYIFDLLDLVFDLDVAAPTNGAPFVPCNNYLTQAEDGLSSDWYGSVWMNPPYSNPTPWVQRFIEHGKGVALLPTSNGRWFGTLWNSGAAFGVLDYIKFNSPAGVMPSSAPNRCWLVAFGINEVKALSKFGQVR